MAVNDHDRDRDDCRDRIAVSPLASYLQLQALPLSYFPWLVAILAGYMTLTQLVKGFYSRRYGWQ